MFLCCVRSTDPSQIHPKLRWWRFRRHLNAPPGELVSDLHSDLAAHIQHVWGFDITWSSGPLKNNFLCVEIGAPWWKIRVWCESRISWVAIEHIKSVCWLYLYIYPAMSVTNTLKSGWKLLRFPTVIVTVIHSPLFRNTLLFCYFILGYLIFFFLLPSAYYLKCIYIFSFGLYFLPKYRGL